MRLLLCVVLLVSFRAFAWGGDDHEYDHYRVLLLNTKTYFVAPVTVAIATSDADKVSVQAELRWLFSNDDEGEMFGDKYIMAEIRGDGCLGLVMEDYDPEKIKDRAMLCRGSECLSLGSMLPPVGAHIELEMSYSYISDFGGENQPEIHKMRAKCF